MITYKTRQEISQAACRLVACDYGFENLSSSKLLNGFNRRIVTLMKARMIRFHPFTLVPMRTWRILIPDNEDILTSFY